MAIVGLLNFKTDLSFYFDSVDNFLEQCHSVNLLIYAKKTKRMVLSFSRSYAIYDYLFIAGQFLVVVLKGMKTLIVSMASIALDSMLFPNLSNSSQASLRKTILSKRSFFLFLLITLNYGTFLLRSKSVPKFLNILTEIIF